MARSNQSEGGTPDDVYPSLLKDAIRADISRRLKKICSNFSDADFENLIELMADNKIKGDRRTAL